MPHVEEVIISKESRGKGTDESPCRIVTVVYSKDGKFIADDDQWKYSNFCEAIPARDPNGK